MLLLRFFGCDAVRHGRRAQKGRSHLWFNRILVFCMLDRPMLWTISAGFRSGASEAHY